MGEVLQKCKKGHGIRGLHANLKRTIQRSKNFRAAQRFKIRLKQKATDSNNYAKVSHTYNAIVVNTPLNIRSGTPNGPREVQKHARIKVSFGA